MFLLLLSKDFNNLDFKHFDKVSYFNLCVDHKYRINKLEARVPIVLKSIVKASYILNLAANIIKKARLFKELSY
jgi:hypothetical protein